VSSIPKQGQEDKESKEKTTMPKQDDESSLAEKEKHHE
jgi:hypothetical protein